MTLAPIEAVADNRCHLLCHIHLYSHDGPLNEAEV